MLQSFSPTFKLCLLIPLRYTLVSVCSCVKGPSTLLRVFISQWVSNSCSARLMKGPKRRAWENVFFFCVIRFHIAWTEFFRIKCASVWGCERAYGVYCILCAEADRSSLRPKNPKCPVIMIAAITANTPSERTVLSTQTLGPLWPQQLASIDFHLSLTGPAYTSNPLPSTIFT